MSSHKHGWTKPLWLKYRKWAELFYDLMHPGSGVQLAVDQMQDRED